MTFDAPKSRHSFGETMDLNFDALSKAYRLKMEGFIDNKRDQTVSLSIRVSINLIKFFIVLISKTFCFNMIIRVIYFNRDSNKGNSHGNLSYIL